MTAPATSNHQGRIVLKRVPGGAVIEVCGVLDWANVGELLADTGRADGDARLLVDLDATERIDSAGTGGLIRAVLHERRQHREVAFVATGAIAEVLDAVGVTQVAAVLPDRPSGEAWLSGGPASPS